MATLDELAVEIREINRANGWNLTTLSDWRQADSKLLESVNFGEPHHQTTGVARDNIKEYWRVFASLPCGRTFCAQGNTPSETIENVKQNILKDPAALYKIPAVLALITSEVSEALEAFRKRDLENFREELADVLIRVLDLAGGLTKDFESVVLAKMDYNRSRGYRHGGKRI